MASRDTKLNIIVNAQDRTARGLSGVQKGLGSMRDQAEKLGDTLRTMGKYGTMAFAALSAASGKLIADSAQSLQIEESYRRMTEQAGIASNTLLEQLQKTSAGTVSATNLMLSANRAMALGVGEDMDTVTTLMEIARLKGRALGLDTTQAFNDIVTGIGRGSPLILDNLGITIKLGEAQEMYAEKLGKTAAELTDAEKKQALLNAVMESGRAEVAAAGEIQVTAAEKLQQLKASFQDTADTLGRTLIPAATRILEAITPVVEKVAAWIEANPKLSAAIIGISIAAAGLLVVLGAIGLAIPVITGALVVFSGTAGLVIGVLAGLGFAVTQVVRIVRLLQTSWDEVWLGIKLITIDAANGVIGIVEKMINGVVNRINGFIQKINRLISRAAQFTGRDLPSLGTLDTVSLSRIDPQATIDRTMERQGPQSQLVITGNNFLSEDAAEQFGDQIMSKLKLSSAL